MARSRARGRREDRCARERCSWSTAYWRRREEPRAFFCRGVGKVNFKQYRRPPVRNRRPRSPGRSPVEGRPAGCTVLARPVPVGSVPPDQPVRCGHHGVDRRGLPTSGAASQIAHVAIQLRPGRVQLKRTPIQIERKGWTTCPFRRCRPPIPRSRSQIPSHADHLGGAEVHRGAGCGG